MRGIISDLLDVKSVLSAGKGHPIILRSRGQNIKRDIFVLSVRESSPDVYRKHLFVELSDRDVDRAVDGGADLDERRRSQCELQRSRADDPRSLKPRELWRADGYLETVSAFLLGGLCFASLDFLRGRYPSARNCRQIRKKHRK